MSAMYVEEPSSEVSTVFATNAATPRRNHLAVEFVDGDIVAAVGSRKGTVPIDPCDEETILADSTESPSRSRGNEPQNGAKESTKASDAWTATGTPPGSLTADGNSKSEQAHDSPETAHRARANDSSVRSQANGAANTAPKGLSVTTSLPTTDFSVIMPELDKMRTFPTTVPLPDLDGDLEFLDFFDPFLGLHPKQIEACAFPPLPVNAEGWSPLENFSASSQTSLQDYGFPDGHGPTLANAQIAESGDLSSHTADSSNCDLEQGWRHDDEQSIPAQVGSLNGAETYQTPQMEKPVVDKHVNLVFSEEVRTALLEDLSHRVSDDLLQGFRLPGITALQKCLGTYVDSFHVHMPIFHLQTLKLSSTPSPLLLAVCAIGALYRLERKVAASLYLMADQALCATVDRRGRPNQKPRLLEDWTQPVTEEPRSHRECIWTSQARLLLSMFACFSGEPDVVAKAIVQLGEFLIDYRELAPTVKCHKPGLEWLTWEQWIERETVKRLLYGHIMFGNLVTITYGIPPGYSIVSDGYIEMPCEQCLWDASTPEKWQELAAWTGKSSSLSLRDAVSKLMCANPSNDVPDECWTWSPFAVNVVINAVSIQIWHITQGSYFLGHFSGHEWPQETQKSQLWVQTEAALSRCRALITQARSDADYAWAEADGPLLFNCLAVLRVSYCRTFTGIGAADSMMLLKGSRAELVASIEDFVAMPQDRSDRVTRAVTRAFEGMLIPYKSGTLLIKKTAALTWAIGHALAGWETALLVTKWVYTIEVQSRRGINGTITEREAQTMQSIRDLLADLEDDESVNQNSVCLAATLARHWAGFYDDTWVWGVTPRMGWALRELANCYESSLPDGTGRLAS
ncbi:hypothetical protein ABEF92_005097 [Exophiala dermatitidis]